MARQDLRVVNEKAQPVPVFRPPQWRGWFTVRRADGPDGVVLETRIPGYLDQDTGHAGQAAAEGAAQEIYEAYCADVRAAITQEQELSA